jgi:hypothetical protein
MSRAKRIGDTMFLHTYEDKSIINHRNALPWLHAKGFNVVRTEIGEYRLFRDDEFVGEASLSQGFLVVMTDTALGDAEEPQHGARYLRAELAWAPVMLVCSEHADDRGNTYYSCIWFSETEEMQRLAVHDRQIAAGAFAWVTSPQPEHGA